MVPGQQDQALFLSPQGLLQGLECLRHSALVLVLTGWWGAGQPAGVLPKPQLFLPTLIETGQDLVSVHTALVWVPGNGSLCSHRCLLSSA